MHQRTTLLRSEVSCPADVSCVCPMAGCRAPELACGKVSEMLEELQSFEPHEVIVDCGPRLSSKEDREQLLAEWQRGVAYISNDLSARLRYWQGLPWLLAGGAHPTASKARKALQEARAASDGLSESARSECHILVQKVFTVEPLCSDVAAFIDSDLPLSAFPNLFQFLAPLALAPTAERVIEATHRQMTGSLKGKTSVNSFSLFLRVPEMLKHLSMTPRAFGNLLEAFQQVRHIRSFADVFPGHGQHPEWVALPQKAQTSRIVSTVGQILYRDAVVQYADLKEASKELAKKKKNTAREPLSEEAVLVQAATLHLRELCHKDPSIIISLPGGSFWAPSLLRPSLLAVPHHTSGAIPVVHKHDMWGTSVQNVGSADIPVVSSIRKGERMTLNLETSVETHGLEACLQEVRIWSPGPDLLYYLPAEGFFRHVVSDVCALFINSGAFPGGQGRVLARSNLDLLVFESLTAKGFVQPHDEGMWSLTADGLNHMQYLHRLSESRVLVSPRDIPKKQLSTFELLMLLRRDGWSWRRLPTKPSVHLRYMIGEGEMLWFTGGLTVSHAYVSCLVLAEQLLADHGVSFIPHGASDEVYEAILQGRDPAVVL